ncbi:hypothetical protein [Streptomyces spongiae]|uniref:Uncharacterized protein n=1 Tax=Streptomyces spongiae TaxID=565072 RepID=A0A5N8XEG7_9ACTN|nr:hypothetical protein [Streptomyces spongiae]MPY57328.1 hypothetical protein [Streptomyces spongiae]
MNETPSPGRVSRGLHLLLDFLDPGSAGLSFGKRLVVIAGAVVIAALALLFGVWITAADPVADHVQESQNAAQERADSKKPPLIQTKVIHEATNTDFAEWVLDRKLTPEEARELKRIRARETTRPLEAGARWAISIGARPVLRQNKRGEVQFRFQLLGTRTEPVVINDIRASVAKGACHFSEAATRIVFHYPTEPRVGEGAKPLHLTFDLDDSEPVAKVRDVNGDLHPYHEDRFEHVRSGGAPSGFVVQARSDRTCDWTIEAAWADGTGDGTFTVDDKGKPFTVEGPVHASEVWVQDLRMGTLLKSPRWFGQPAAGPTRTDRYYQAWVHYIEEHHRQPSGRQLSAVLAGQGIKGADSRPVRPDALSRHFPEFRLYSDWSSLWARNGYRPGTGPSAKETASMARKSSENSWDSADAVEKYLPEFRRRHHALARDEAKDW